MDHNEAEVSRDMYNFLLAFYEAHPKLLKNPFFLFGESYGGHYVPATALAVLRGNVAKKGVHVPLTGLSVGNGLTAPEIQYRSVLIAPKTRDIPLHHHAMACGFLLSSLTVGVV